METDSERQKSTNVIRNYVLLGSTGSGKSTTCNTIMKIGTGQQDFEYFPTSDEAGSCTLYLRDFTLQSHGIKVVDTPGFNDTRFDENKIDEIIKGLTLRIVDPAGSSSNCIDAFFLVVKLTPRAETLKSDVEHLRNIFGTICLKSTILVVIDQKKRDKDKLMNFFETQAGEVKRIFEEAKGEKFNPSWVVFWDNFEYRPDQFSDLLAKASKVEPYTHEKFLQATEEIKQRIDARVNQIIEERMAQIRKDHTNDLQKRDKMIRELHQQMEADKNLAKQHLEEAKRSSEELAQKMKSQEGAMECLKKLHTEEMVKLKEELEESKKRGDTEQSKFFEMLLAQQQEAQRTAEQRWKESEAERKAEREQALAQQRELEASRRETERIMMQQLVDTQNKMHEKDSEFKNMLFQLQKDHTAEMEKRNQKDTETQLNMMKMAHENQLRIQSLQHQLNSQSNDDSGFCIMF